jgi:hypothetical protein
MYRKTLVVCILAILVAGCAIREDANVDTVVTQGATAQSVTQLPRYAPAGCPVYTHDVGVYYFDCETGTFARALARFKKDKPDFVVTAMTGDTFNSTGYFVSTEPRQIVSSSK